MNKTLLLFLLFPALSFAFDVVVVNVVDGDTLTVITDKKRFLDVRLFGVDAPELKQEYGEESKANLQKLCNGKAEMEIMGSDRYGRMLCELKCKNRNAGLYQLKNGAAWAYTEYLSKEPPALSNRYVKAELAARTKKRGLWEANAPIPPWEWRKKHLDNTR